MNYKIAASRESCSEKISDYELQVGTQWDENDIHPSPSPLFLRFKFRVGATGWECEIDKECWELLHLVISGSRISIREDATCFSRMKVILLTGSTHEELDGISSF